MSDDHSSAHLSTDDLDWRLIDQYLAGTLTGDDATQVDRWLAAHRTERAELERVRLIVTGRLRDPDIDPAVMLARLRQRFQTARRSQPTRRPSVYPQRGVLAPTTIWYTLWYTLAGIALAAAALLIVWPGHSLHTRWHSPTSPASVATYVTGSGQRANITLNDGTTVALDVASRLDVPADYPVGDHTIRLTGEALFTVQHHTGKPFTVLAGGTTTRVLGTSFIVRHYATDTTTTVAVRDGKVALRATVVAAAQQAEVGSSGVVRVQPATPAQFSFATGMLTLDGVPFPAAIVELDRWYDADIRLGDPALATRRVAGEYAAGSLSDLTAYLEMTFNVRVVRNGRVLTLYQR